MLGSRLGAISIAVYAFIGLAGAPVFARFTGGFSQLLSPTFGFIIAFIFTAYLTGKIVESFSTRGAYIMLRLYLQLLFIFSGRIGCILLIKFGQMHHLNLRIS